MDFSLCSNGSALPLGGGAFPGALACSVRSVPTPRTQSSDPFPSYPAETLLSAPAFALPPSWPFLGAVLGESSVAAGKFFVLAGGGAGGALGVPPCAIPSWSDSNIALCPAALAAASGLAGAAALSAPPSLAFSVSGSTHLLLAPPRKGGPPLSAGLTASLAGVPCITNWVAADGSVASITTPRLAALCQALGASTNASDCGYAQLVLSAAPWTAAAAPAATLVRGGTIAMAEATQVQAQASDAALSLPLPAAFPPLLVGLDWGAAYSAAAVQAAASSGATLPAASSPFGQLASLLGPPGSAQSAALATAESLAPLGVGIRALLACSDPSFSPPAACAAAAFATYAQPLELLCAWGAGDSCTPCPLGAACPGGSVLLPLPGFWAPTSSSPPSQLEACPQPSATARCPGWRNASSAGLGAPAALTAGAAFGCGSGYAGVVCASCAPHFFQSEGACVPCPSLTVSAELAVATPFLALGGALAALVALASTAVLYAGLAASPREALFAVGELAMFFAAAAQSAAASFRLAQSLAPSNVAGLFTVLAALQLAGLSLPPSCFGSPPFLAVYVAVGIAVALVAAAAVALAGALVQAWRRSGSSAQLSGGAGKAHDAVDSLPQESSFLLSVACTGLALGYGAGTGVAVPLLICTPHQPLSVRAYLALANDGATLLAAAGDAASPLAQALAAASASLPDLLRAAVDPPFTAARGLGAALDASVPVSLLASDLFRVCREAEHRGAWNAALALLVLLGICLAVEAAASAPQRRGCAAGAAGSTPAQKPPPESAAGPMLICHRPRALLLASLIPRDVRRTAAWFVPLQQALSSASSALLSAAAMSTTTGLFCGLLGLACVLQLSLAALMLRAQPFAAAAAWKTPATALLLLLPCAASLASIVLLLGLRGGLSLSQDGRTAVASLPLALAMPLPPLLFYLWWHARLRMVRQRSVAAASPAAAAGVEVEEEVRVFTSPLRAGPGAIAAAIRGWACVVDDDGDVFWFHAASGKSVWELPDEMAEAALHVWRRAPPSAGGGLPHWHWACNATGAVAASDANLPLGAATEDGWVLRGEIGEEGEGGGEVWWYHGGSGEAMWEGPWLHAEAAAAETAAAAAAAEAEAAAVEAASAAADPGGTAAQGIDCDEAELASAAESREEALAVDARLQVAQFAVRCAEVEAEKRAAATAAERKLAAAAELAEEEKRKRSEAVRAAEAEAEMWRTASVEVAAMLKQRGGGGGGVGEHVRRTVMVLAGEEVRLRGEEAVARERAAQQHASPQPSSALTAEGGGAAEEAGAPPEIGSPLLHCFL